VVNNLIIIREDNTKFKTKLGQKYIIILNKMMRARLEWEIAIYQNIDKIIKILIKNNKITKILTIYLRTKVMMSWTLMNKIYG
jgi:hypothetical protein